MPTLEARARRAYRLLRGQPLLVQAVAAVAALSLVGGVVTVGAKGGGSDRTSALVAGEPGGGVGTQQPGAPFEQGPPGTTPAAPGEPGAPVGETPGLPGAGTFVGGGGGLTGPGGGVPAPIRLTASDRGVTAKTVKVVFPWFTQGPSDEATGTHTDIENQEDAIRAFVNDINAHGGILGRSIDPLVVPYNTLNTNDMVAKCEKWAKDDKVFAVVDGVGAWHSEHQLCLTQQNKTPLLSGWTTVSDWTKRGEPYLWWTGPTAEEIVDHTILWANRKGLLTRANQHEVAMAFSDRDVDKLVLKHMQAALKRLNLSIALEVIPFSPHSAQAALPGAITRLKGKGIKKLIGMLPFTTFASWLNHAEAQDFYPRYILSDFESGMVVAEALFGPAHPRSLHRAIGPVSLDLGVENNPAKFSAEEKRCAAIWAKAFPEEDPLGKAGVGMRWCQGVSVFTEGARRATLTNGGSLTRLNWAASMATIRDLPGAMTPSLSWAPGDYAGTEWMKIVEVRTSGCSEALDDDGNGACHIQVEPFARIKRFS